MAWGPSNVGGRSSKAESYAVTLLTSGWVADTTYADYGFRYKYTMDGITDRSIVNIALDATSVNVAIEAGMLSATETALGCIYFYAESVPSANLTGVAFVYISIPGSDIAEGFNPNEYAKTGDVQVAMDTAVAAQAAADSKAPAPAYGTDDLTAGVSRLEAGKMYIVYE